MVKDQIIIIKASGTKGKEPKTVDLQFGELAINTFDGKLFARRSDKKSDELITFDSNLSASKKIEKITNTHSIVLDASSRQVKEISIANHTAIVLSDLPKAKDTLIELTLIINNNGDNAVKWDASIIWNDGVAPKIGSNATSIIRLFISTTRVWGVVFANNLIEV